MSRSGPQPSSGSAATTNGANATIDAADQPAAQPDAAPALPGRPQEHGGRDGPEPTRYGDWEKSGRCIDF